MEEIIVKFAEVFIKSLKMLNEEIRENAENNHNLNDIDNLVNEWNELYDNYIEKENSEND